MVSSCGASGLSSRDEWLGDGRGRWEAILHRER